MPGAPAPASCWRVRRPRRGWAAVAPDRAAGLEAAGGGTGGVGGGAGGAPPPFGLGGGGGGGAGGGPFLGLCWGCFFFSITLDYCVFVAHVSLAPPACPRA